MHWLDTNSCIVSMQSFVPWSVSAVLCMSKSNSLKLFAFSCNCSEFWRQNNKRANFHTKAVSGFVENGKKLSGVVCLLSIVDSGTLSCLLQSDYSWPRLAGIITVHSSNRQYCFHQFFFLCVHDNSWTAALGLMKFCRNMYLDNRSKPREFQGQRSKSQYQIYGFFIVVR